MIPHVMLSFSNICEVSIGAASEWREVFRCQHDTDPAFRNQRLIPWINLPLYSVMTVLASVL